MDQISCKRLRHRGQPAPLQGACQNIRSRPRALPWAVILRRLQRREQENLRSQSVQTPEERWLLALRRVPAPKNGAGLSLERGTPSTTVLLKSARNNRQHQMGGAAAIVEDGLMRGVHFAIYSEVVAGIGVAIPSRE